MKNNLTKQETRIIPEQAPAKFYAQHLKPYEFLRNDSAGKRVLELGCGDGYGSFYLAKIASRAVGIDYEEKVILQAKNKYRHPNLSFLCMNATNLGFKDNSFDIICSFQVIEHIPENKLMLYLSEIKRVLSPGGRFYLSTLNLEHNMKSPLTYKKNSAHCKEFKVDELKKLLLDIFPAVRIYGLRLAPKHSFYQRLKKIGLLNLLPQRINPVNRFYNRITTEDFIVTAGNLKKASDFICTCTKSPH
ncbi:MAG: class I SAM-dependent methyltransferase [Candidatus Omnitrophota bacterium]